VLNIESQMELYEYCTQIIGAEYPKLRQTKNPCPTLKIIGAVTQDMGKREELAHMHEMGHPGMDVFAEEERPKITKAKKAAVVADCVVVGFSLTQSDK
jgi:hypothetical protein